MLLAVKRGRISDSLLSWVQRVRRAENGNAPRTESCRKRRKCGEPAPIRRTNEPSETLWAGLAPKDGRFKMRATKNHLSNAQGCPALLFTGIKFRAGICRELDDGVSTKDGGDIPA